jgi:signal transduction histidine kinase
MATTTTTSTTELLEPPQAEQRRRSVLEGIRARILVGFVGVLAFATGASVLVAREVLLSRLDERIGTELRQEATELRQLAGGADPQTGEPFGDDVRRVFEVFLERNVPATHEAMLTFVDGEPYLRSRSVQPYRLDTDPELVALWAGLDSPSRGRVETPAGRVEYLAVPVRAEGRTLGVFVVAAFRDIQARVYDDAILATAGVGLAVLLFGTLLAWRVAESVLRPVATVTQAARAISDSDLSRRIAVEGRDELAELAGTFNDMLDRLERAFTLQRRFLDDASHELRTPITIARGHLELLEDEPQQRAATLVIVLDELDRMSRFVDDLLLLAKAGSPDFLRLDTVELGALVDELETKVTALAPRRWRVDARSRGRIVADRQRLTQALLQLAQNAVDHTGEEDEIALGAALDNGHARIWVRDTGTGIPEAEQARVFDRFSRLPGRRRRDGAGLGLSIVKAIAEAHHGRVELASAPGRGSTFTLVVPADHPGEPLQ